jgi:hypothetical protein
MGGGYGGVWVGGLPGKTRAHQGVGGGATPCAPKVCGCHPQCAIPEVSRWRGNYQAHPRMCEFVLGGGDKRVHPRVWLVGQQPCCTQGPTVCVVKMKRLQRAHAAMLQQPPGYRK